MPKKNDLWDPIVVPASLSFGESILLGHIGSKTDFSNIL